MHRGKYIVLVVKTMTHQTVFLPLFSTKKLKLGDLISDNEDFYLILDALPAEYGFHIKAIKVDECPLESYSDFNSLDKQTKEHVEAIVLPIKNAENLKALGVKLLKGVLMYSPPKTGKILIA